jgi:hypothetical protein
MNNAEEIKKLKKAEINRRYRLKNKEKIKISGKIYYEKNKELIIDRTREYRKNYHEKTKDLKKADKKEYDRVYHLKNKDSRNLYNRNYNEANKERLSYNHKEYYVDHMVEIKKRVYENHKKRIKTDPAYKLLCNTRARIRNFLKSKNIIRHVSTAKLVGCDAEFLRKYIQKQFRSGMTLENNSRYGWHLDHIIPCSYFDQSDPEQQKKCWHYTNLQPLWWWENLAKSDKLPEIKNPIGD